MVQGIMTKSLLRLFPKVSDLCTPTPIHMALCLPDLFCWEYPECFFRVGSTGTVYSAKKQVLFSSLHIVRQKV
jgi:hypothetical protein